MLVSSLLLLAQLSPFEARGLTGTVVIENLAGTHRHVINAERAKQPFAPASTFKIPNTLIALEEKTAAGPEEPFRWDGTRHDFPLHNQDQTLASAYKVSCVWCFQQLAGRLNHDVYRRHLRQLLYGRITPQFTLTNFWLNAELQISAQEQVEFLRGIVQRRFPYSARSYDLLRTIMVEEQTAQYTLRAKTGWFAAGKPQVGWYVGYVETAQDTWLFALNLDIRDSNDLSARLAIAREVLTAQGILPAN